MLNVKKYSNNVLSSSGINLRGSNESMGVFFIVLFFYQ